MNAKIIIRSLVRWRYAKSFTLPNYTPAQWWECDVFHTTNAGYFTEFEVKVSREDFFNDATKVRTERRTNTVFNKHDLLAAGSHQGPSRFFFVVPVGLVKEHEVPKWAGVIEVAKTERARFCTETIVRPAPRLHDQKFDAKILVHAKGVCYWRLHRLLSKSHFANV